MSKYIITIEGDFEKGECEKCPLVKKEYGVDVIAYVCCFRTKEGLCPLEEVKRGEWINLEGQFDVVQCSECHKVHERVYRFCPNCGADMRGDK